MNWYDESYRKLFFDFHTHSSSKDVAIKFNAQKWASRLKDTGVQAISCFAKCAFGWRYYRNGKTGYIHPKMPEEMDMLAETIEACHKEDIRVIAYYHTFLSEAVAGLHPEWVERNKDGTLRDINICQLSPVAEDQILPQVQEIVRNYDIDGIFFDGTYARPCYCESCKKKFFDMTGKQIPRESSDSNWAVYAGWVLEQYKQLRMRIIEVIKKEKPDVKIAFNWAYTVRQPEEAPADIGFYTLDIFPDNQLFNASLQARNWAMDGKPFDIMNTGFLKWWGEWGIKPAAALKRECAAIIANGGKTFIGYQMYPQFEVEKAVLETMKETFDFVKEREKLCEDTVIVQNVAVLHSTAAPSVLYTPDIYVDLDSLKGLHKLFTASSIHYNSMGEKTLLKNIGDYNAIIIPEQLYISPMLLHALEDYVKNGGSLLFAGNSGSIDENGNSSENSILYSMAGIKPEGKYPYSHGYIEIRSDIIGCNVSEMPVLTVGDFNCVIPTGAQVLADLRGVHLRGDGNYQLRFSPPGEPTGHPAITVNRYGKGKVVYIACDIFKAYYGTNQWNIKNIVKNIVNDILLERTSIKIDAPGVVEIVLAKQGSDFLIHFINSAGPMPQTSFSNTVDYVISEDIIPVYNIGVQLFSSKRPVDIKLMPEGQSLEWTYDNGQVSFTVPRLDIHNCAVIHWE